MVCCQAGKIAHVLNERFQNEALWAGFYGNSQEVTQGIVLTLHAIQTNGVGIKGMDFFTCSYAFIGTVSLICSNKNSFKLKCSKCFWISGHECDSYVRRHCDSVSEFINAKRTRNTILNCLKSFLITSKLE